MSDFVVRPIVPGDLETICRHRHEMFKVSGRTDEMVAPMTEHFRPWLRPLLDDERYFGWLIEAGHGPVAGVGMMIIDWPPHPSHPTQSARGYVLNMYVERNIAAPGSAGSSWSCAIGKLEGAGSGTLSSMRRSKDEDFTRSSAGLLRLRCLSRSRTERRRRDEEQDCGGRPDKGPFD